MSSDPRVSIVVPTYQRCDMVAATLDALAAQKVAGAYEVIVVDNGSTDGTSRLLAERVAEDDRVRVLRLEPNRGPGRARNAGWRAARAPVVAFTDDDCVPDPGWLGAILEATDAGADVVMGRTLPDPDALASGGPFSHWVRVEEPMPWFPTCNIAYRRDLLRDLGGFDETFTARMGTSFGDDTDLGWRALEAGADARFAPDGLVVHEVTESDWRAWLRARRRRAGVPEVVARHPGLRAQLPRRWAYERAHPPALLAAVGLLTLLARPRSLLAWCLGVLLATPYVRFRTRGLGYRPVPGSTRPAAVAGMLLADLVEIGVVARHARRAGVILV